VAVPQRCHVGARPIPSWLQGCLTDQPSRYVRTVLRLEVFSSRVGYDSPGLPYCHMSCIELVPGYLTTLVMALMIGAILTQ